jgi:peptidyl-dipeptidase A
VELNAAGWTQATFINVDTQLLNARTYERFLEQFSRAVEEAKKFEGQPMSPASRRSIDLLKLGVSAPAPDDAAKRAELATILTGMEARYGSAKYCKDGGKDCRDEVQLKTVLEQSRNYDELLDAWRGWHDQARALRGDYTRYVSLANEGARELGYQDLGAMWRSGYDMPADDFTREAARLYSQVEPLYKDLQCFARGRLARQYGEDRAMGRGLFAAGAVSWREPGRRRRCAGRPELRPGADDEVGRVVLHVDRLPAAAGDVLGALDAFPAA